MAAPHPLDLLRPGREITGMAAVLLPFAGGAVDWPGFERLLRGVAGTGLVPAVNMDTGYANLIDEATRTEVLDRTASLLGGSEFVGGAFVGDRPGDAWSVDVHAPAMAAVADRGGTPIVFPCHGLAARDGAGWVAAHAELGERCDRFLAFELSTEFAPFGVIHDLATYRELLGIAACVGAKHSSLHRQPEWDRLRLRDEVRPGFRVLTGNDLAIDMVVYGSDYLLGLAAFAPDRFAERDALWAAGDAAFWERNDALQALGAFAFRPPVPAYRHSAAQFLALRGRIDEAEPHPDADRRPDSDVAVLQTLLDRIEAPIDPGESP